MLVLLALVGCTKMELAPTPAKEVTFTVGKHASMETKAVSLDNYSITSFKSKGFLHAEGYESVTQDFFGANGETISKNGNEWVPSHPYYWPKSELSYVNFVSWYDKNGAPTTVSETALEWTNRTIEANDDIMYADEAWRFRDNTTNASQYNSDATLTGVPTLFHHALAQVKFQAKLSDATEGNVRWTLSISNFKVENVHKTGSLSLRNSDEQTDYHTKSWTNTSWIPSSNVAADTLSHAGTYTMGANYQVLMNTRTVMPQTTYGMVLSFDYSINTYYEIAGNQLVSVSENARATVDLYEVFRIYNWSVNTCVTYNIIINPKTNKITFAPTLSDWTTDLNNTIYVE